MIVGDHIICEFTIPMMLECLDSTCEHYDNCDLVPGPKSVHHEPRLKGCRNDEGTCCVACLDWRPT